jgi:hypothetical protein
VETPARLHGRLDAKPEQQMPTAGETHGKFTQANMYVASTSSALRKSSNSSRASNYSQVKLALPGTAYRCLATAIVPRALIASQRTASGRPDRRETYQTVLTGYYDLLIEFTSQGGRFLAAGKIFPTRSQHRDKSANQWVSMTRHCHCGRSPAATVPNKNAESVDTSAPHFGS